MAFLRQQARCSWSSTTSSTCSRRPRSSASCCESAARLKVLATSRAPLRLRAEREYPVPPLALPRRMPPLPRSTQLRPVRGGAPLHRAGPGGQARLRRRQTRMPPAVAEICRRLDGLPLAIELAAARVAPAAAAGLLARLGAAAAAPDRRSARCARPAADPARHHRLELRPAGGRRSRRLFRRLAVFAGGCTLEAAEAVANPTGTSTSSADWPHWSTRACCGAGRSGRGAAFRDAGDDAGIRAGAAGSERRGGGGTPATCIVRPGAVRTGRPGAAGAAARTMARSARRPSMATCAPPWTGCWSEVRQKWGSGSPRRCATS